MKMKDEIVNRFQLMQESLKDLNNIIQKYRQQTEYVCLKTGVNDWMTFLTEIRLGKISYHSNQSDNEANSKETKYNNNSALQLLNNIFAGQSTNRSTGRRRNCECQSPIGSQGSLRRIRGGDTERSQSNQDEHNAPKIIEIENQLNHMQNIDPFNKFKIENIMSPKQQRKEQSISQILKYIENYQAQKSIPIQGFETFRKLAEKDQNLTQTREFNDSLEKSAEEYTISSERNNGKTTSSRVVENQFKPFWKNKENSPIGYRQWNLSSYQHYSNEYTLAIQNTKLRRQLKQMEFQLLKLQKL